MEEDIIYDLEGASQASHAEGAEEQRAQEEMEISEGSEILEGSEESESSESSDNSDISEAEKEIERMVGEMGAETLLKIIRDNRNAAIRQIISEVEASQRHDLPSGASAARGCSSIFDLAALA